MEDDRYCPNRTCHPSLPGTASGRDACLGECPVADHVPRPKVRRAGLREDGRVSGRRRVRAVVLHQTYVPFAPPPAPPTRSSESPVQMLTNHPTTQTAAPHPTAAPGPRTASSSAARSTSPSAACRAAPGPATSTATAASTSSASSTTAAPSAPTPDAPAGSRATT